MDQDFVMIEHHHDRSPHLDSISQYVDALNDGLRKVSLEIHDHPELQYKEFHAHDGLTKYLATQAGWKVTKSAHDIRTAFVAVYDSGRPGPTVSFNAEYDALKGIGHACGHNLNAIASVGGALAAAKLVTEARLGGKVVLFGTPAEEGGGGKIKLLDAGAYKGVDVSLISHPGITANAALMRTAAYASFKVEYFGKEAHAAAAPWQGINALDALITAYNAISVLRQQTQPGDIIQGHITNGGLRPNIIHAYSAGMFVVRSRDRSRLEALKSRVLKCFDAGAIATGATVKVTPKSAYDDHMPNQALGGDIPPPELAGSTMASTDQGNVSYHMPSISPNFWIRSESEDGQ
ncbi:Peptidase M20 domain-containing protein 2 [Fulvia fulva]|uniref:Peptidase M20 domain-containing protein 2 n=1 Tax=Passalora fulva TaxID=5499 RepID=A0A9Q8L6F0_PASFU|nr:Peptidase M20 domain-containing protein 2 [Fulvia fulva]KAK4634667.1 Peptidase M20 domain-containing protein 2 [Fulvia fulva]KAK4637061.1 Peptidase M20 domain-containing protein 2 [Fulvia fulva]UJO11722.1 Peptidase M20 domain-containing protein 2 [Fulvia fulva]WPV09043.1 Peptidase M20 domain-containing protein 2 [Fulvia fulva]WPV24314.1 Peptidase M20 domain-containing protein 2 [Fulvia fulva]